MMPPLISIITPTRNSAKIIEQCLQSVAIQEFSAWEHWIIDSESTDGTAAIVRELCQRDARVHFLSEPDDGIYDGMNKGISRATGHWLYFLGSDDRLHNEKVLSNVSTLLTDDADFVYGNVQVVPANIIYDGPFDIEKLFIANICHQAIFIRRQVFDGLGAFNTSLPYYADWAHNIECFLDNSVRKRYIDLVVADFRAGGFSSRGDDFDLGWKLAKAKLLSRYLKISNENSVSLLRIFEAIEASNEGVARELASLRQRHSNLLRIHGELLNSRTYRVMKSLRSSIQRLLSIPNNKQ
jgi:glycosyltransferase involved in cell wall biosynthesis